MDNNNHEPAQERPEAGPLRSWLREWRDDLQHKLSEELGAWRLRSQLLSSPSATLQDPSRRRHFGAIKFVLKLLIAPAIAVGSAFTLFTHLIPADWSEDESEQAKLEAMRPNLEILHAAAGFECDHWRGQPLSVAIDKSKRFNSDGVRPWKRLEKYCGRNPRPPNYDIRVNAAYSDLRNAIGVDNLPYYKFDDPPKAAAEKLPPLKGVEDLAPPEVGWLISTLQSDLAHAVLPTLSLVAAAIVFAVLARFGVIGRCRGAVPPSSLYLYAIGAALFWPVLFFSLIDPVLALIQKPVFGEGMGRLGNLALALFDFGEEGTGWGAFAALAVQVLALSWYWIALKRAARIVVVGFNGLPSIEAAHKSVFRRMLASWIFVVFAWNVLTGVFSIWLALAATGRM